MAKMGAPLTYSLEIQQETKENVCTKIALGKNLAGAFDGEKVPLCMHNDWLLSDITYRRAYIKALDLCKHVLEQEIDDLVDILYNQSDIVKLSALKEKIKHLRQRAGVCAAKVHSLAKKIDGTTEEKLKYAELRVAQEQIMPLHVEREAKMYNSMSDAVKSVEEAEKAKIERKIMEEIGADGDTIKEAIKILKENGDKKFTVEKLD